jgi:pyruvate formate lyase activating enzyme
MARGICQARQNRGGTLFADYYGQVSFIANDPIEKKPLRWYKPGTNILSIGSFGCNFHCDYCQNYSISLEHGGRESRFMLPEDLLPHIRDFNSIGLAYTYNEPTINYEYIYDCSVFLKSHGLDNVLVTNGYINIEPLDMLLPYIDAMNIDLKGFTEEFYKKIGGRLDRVKEVIAYSAKRTHVEVTTLVIPGRNDTVKEIDSLAAWLAKIGDIPLHLTMFRPMYRAGKIPHATVGKVRELQAVAGKRLKRVYSV